MNRPLWVAALLTVSLSAQAPPASSTAQGEWPTYGGDLANTKYSPLDQVTAANFSSLKIAWRAPSPDGFLSMTLPDGSEWAADSKAIFAELSRIDPKRWRDNQPPFVQNYKATPLMVGGTLYVNTPSSVGAAYDARTGKKVYEHRLGTGGSFTSSPIAADGKVYVSNEEGQTFVIKAGPQFEILGVSKLDGYTLASPIAVDDRLFIRTGEALYCIGRKR